MEELKGQYYGAINEFFENTSVEFLRMEEVKNPKEKNKSQYFFFKNKETSEEFKVRFHFNDDDYLKVLTDTRHQFSHYISKNNSLSEGKDYIINFVLFAFYYWYVNMCWD